MSGAAAAAPAEDLWVVWNGALGMLDLAAIGSVEASGGQRHACLAAPYEAVGPFDLDALDRDGRIVFGACIIMSRARWQQDQTALRRAARAQRHAAAAPLHADNDDSGHREVLGLPGDGPLAPALVNAAFRRLAKTAHPDAGGSDARYHQISEARDALLRRLAVR
jgi:hypothetical protein